MFTVNSLPTRNDEDFLAAFESGRIENLNFHHRDHLRLAWIQIKRLGVEQGSDAVAAAIQRFAARHGHAHLYHDTLTRFWLRAVGLGIDRHPDLSFDALILAEPHLLDKQLPCGHWSPARMSSDEARAHWVDPDLRRLPERHQDVFRRLMSSVPSSVAVLTVVDPEHEPRAITVSAFCSVSLDPLLLLVCIGNRSRTLRSIMASGSFTLNFLGWGGEDIARRMATPGADKLDAVRSSSAAHVDGGPILHDGATIFLVCRVDQLVPAGDHTIVIGRVVDGGSGAAGGALVHMGGRFVDVPATAGSSAD